MFVCFLGGEAARNFPFHKSHYSCNAVRSIQIFHFKIKYLQKKNLYLFHFHEEFTRRGNGRVRNGRVLSWLSCRRNRRIAITIQQTITPPVCKYSTALDCVMRTTRGTTREKCRAYDKTNNKKKKKNK